MAKQHFFSFYMDKRGYSTKNNGCIHNPHIQAERVLKSVTTRYISLSPMAVLLNRMNTYLDQRGT